MKLGAFFRAGAASLLLPLAAHGQEATPPPKPAPLPPMQRESAPAPDYSAPKVDTEPTTVEAEPTQQPLPKDHDPNWLLKGVQAEQKAAEKTQAQDQTNAADAQANTLRDPGKAISATDPLGLHSKADAAQQKQAADGKNSSTGFKPLIGGLSGDTAKPLQQQNGQTTKIQAANASKPILPPTGINPDLIRPIEFDRLESPAINPDIAAPTFNEGALSSTAIKVPTGYEGTGITAPVMPGMTGMIAPAAPSAPQAPALRAVSISMPTAPRPIAPLSVPTISKPVAPTLPSIPAMPRLADPNDELPLRH